MTRKENTVKPIIAQGTMTGPIHVKNRQQNQDAYKSFSNDTYTVLVAADGAGSLKKSALGSQLACETIVENISENFEKNSSENFMNLVYDAIAAAREALLSHEDADEMGCTVAVALFTDIEWAVGVSGDAFAVVSQSETDHSFFSSPRKSEYANITNLLTSNDWLPVMAHGKGSPIAISVATDGMTFASIKDGEPTSGFWGNIVKKCRNNSLNIDELFKYMYKNDKIVDDTTLVMAARVFDHT